MKINAQWLLFIAFLPKWKLTLLSLIIPFIAFLFYYLFIYTDYQQEITQQHVEMAQRLKRINHHQSTLETMPTINSLIAQQIDYDIPLNTSPVSEQLQHLLRLIILYRRFGKSRLTLYINLRLLCLTHSF